MTKVATSFSRFQHSQTAAEACVRDALKKMDTDRADFAIVYTSTHHHKHLDSITQTIKRATQVAHVVGSSNYGVITEDCEIEDEPAVALMLVKSNEIRATAVLAHNLQESSFKAGAQVGSALNERGCKPAALWLSPDHYSFQPALFFDALSRQLGEVPCIGSTASENGEIQKVYQMHNEEVTFDAASVLALEGPVRLEYAVTQSCYPFGDPVRITRSKGDEIYEIDGRPAYDLFLEYASRVEGMHPDQTHHNILMGLPLHSFQTEFSKSNYLIRNIAEINTKSGMISCAAPVEEGEYITFTVRDAEKARLDLESTLCDLRQRMSAPPVFGFYFNCCTRGQALYQEKDIDIRLIRDFFPKTPILGCFSYGEIAPIDFTNHMHHYSGALCFITGL